MTTPEIANRLSALVKEERRITQEILDLINIALGQRAYLELGYPSMFEWLTKGFGYSHSAAYRRIEAAKLLRAVPEAASKLERGEINLSVLAKAQSVFRAEGRISASRNRRYHPTFSELGKGSRGELKARWRNTFSPVPRRHSR